MSMDLTLSHTSIEAPLDRIYQSSILNHHFFTVIKLFYFYVRVRWADLICDYNKIEVIGC